MDDKNITCMGIIYKVKLGDTLYNVSRKYGVRVLDVMKANPYVNVYNLQEGEEICVPTVEMENYEPPKMSPTNNNMMGGNHNMPGMMSNMSVPPVGTRDDDDEYNAGRSLEERGAYQVSTGPAIQPPIYQVPTGPAIQPPIYQVPTGPAIQPPIYQVPTGPAVQPPINPIPSGPSIQPPIYPMPTGPAIQPPIYPMPTGPAIQPPIAPVPTGPSTGGRPISGFRPYVVAGNDTIAKIMTKTGMSFDELYRYNKSLGNIAVPRGTILLIPVQVMPYD